MRHPGRVGDTLVLTLQVVWDDRIRGGAGTWILARSFHWAGKTEEDEGVVASAVGTVCADGDVN